MPEAGLRRAAPGASVASSLAEALSLTGDPVVAAGSLRLVGAFLEYAGVGTS